MEFKNFYFISLILLIVFKSAHAEIQIGTIVDISPIEFSESGETTIEDESGILKIRLQDITLNQGDQIKFYDGLGNLFQEISSDEIDTESFWTFSANTTSIRVEFFKFDEQSNSHFIIQQIGLLTPQTESVCGVNTIVDIACAPSDRQEKATSVGIVIVPRDNIFILCTGFLVSDGNHFLTNEHCLKSQESVNNTEVIFKHQLSGCGGGELLTGERFRGDLYLRSDFAYDYILMTLKGDPVSEFGHLTLTPTGPSIGEQIYAVQHPGGQPKKYDDGTVFALNTLGRGNLKRSNFSYLNLDTQGGSSGSPILSGQSGNVVGIHNLGSFCTNGEQGNSAVNMKNIYPAISSFLVSIEEEKDNPAYLIPIIDLIIQESQTGN